MAVVGCSTMAGHHPTSGTCGMFAGGAEVWNEVHNSQANNRGDFMSSLVEKFADRYSVDKTKVLDILKATAFKQKDGGVPSNEQMAALMIVADQYGLNPFTKEIYAFPDKKSGIIPVVGVDGWSRIINSHPQFDGMEFIYSEEMVTPEAAKSQAHQWVECAMYRKDRSRAIIIREYLDEVYRGPFETDKGYQVDGPWQSHPKRFQRHKAMIQCARIAFGFAGIFDQDEAERIADNNNAIDGTATLVPADKVPEKIGKKMVEKILLSCSTYAVGTQDFCAAMNIAAVEDLDRARMGEAQAYFEERKVQQAALVQQDA